MNNHRGIDNSLTIQIVQRIQSTLTMTTRPAVHIWSLTVSNNTRALLRSTTKTKPFSSTAKWQGIFVCWLPEPFGPPYDLTRARQNLSDTHGHRHTQLTVCWTAELCATVTRCPVIVEFHGVICRLYWTLLSNGLDDTSPVQSVCLWQRADRVRH